MTSFTTACGYSRGQGRSVPISRSKKLLLSLTFLLFTFSAFSQLNGVKTIDPSGSGPNNYTSFSAAVSDLVNQGVNGPVLFQVAAGTYSGPIEIPSISGVNSLNTVTFDGGHGNAANRVIEYGASGQWDEDVLRLVSSQWLRFKNLTIRATAKSFGVAVHLLNDCSNTQFINCTIEAPVSTNWYHRAFVANSTTASNDGTCGWGSYQTNILIDSSTIIGGYYGVLGLTGGGDFYVTNSSLLDCYSYGIAVGYNNYYIRNNYIRMDQNNAGNEAIRYCNGSPTFEVSGNIIENGGYAGFISYSGSTQGRGKIFNNYIRMNASKGQSLGIALQTTAENNIDIWNNTITIEISDNPTSAGINVASGLTGEDIQNNNILILSPTSQAQAVNSSSGSVTTMDYNNYYRVNKSPSVLLTVNGTSYLESDYKTATGYNQNSTIDNPQIASLTSPIPGNICLLGTSLFGVTTDITGASRPNPPTIGAYERSAGLNLDAEVAAFTKPAFPVASGNNDIEVLVKNKGVQAITSLDINIELGSVTKTINWTGTLSPCSEMTVLFTGSNQLNIGPGTNQIRAWVASPNGSTDQNTSNDELVTNVCLPFTTGTYTIDPSGSGPNNFTSFKAAAEALNCGGVDGTVEFNVAATTFNNDEFKLVFVKGLSSANTITLKGAGVGSTVITHPNTYGSAVISLTGTPYVTIENMTIRATPDYDRALIQLASGSDYVTIRNNSLEYTSYNTTSCFGIVYGAISTNPSGNEANYTVIENNTFSNTGYGAIWATSSNYTSKNTGLIIRNNTISNNWFTGIRISYTDNMTIEKNRITMGNYQWNYALMVEVSNNNKIRDNHVRNGGYAGIYFFCTNSELVNNIVTDPANNQWGSGIQVVAANGSKIYHNTVFFNHQAFTNENRAVFNVQNSNGIDVRNNIFIYKGQTSNGAIIYKDPWSSFSNLDHNIYHADIGNVYTEDFGTYFKTLADFKAYQPAWNEFSKEEFPVFINSGGPIDAHLSSSYDAPSGLNLGVTTDVDGDLRCTFAPTIGADQSTYPQLTPDAAFVSGDSIYENSGTRMVNTSKGDPTKYVYYWLVDGVMEAATRDFDYTFTSTGNYEIKLVVEGCSGKDTSTDTVSVFLPTSSPLVNFVADKQIVDLYQQVNLRDASKFGPTQWQWSATPSYDAFFINDLAQNTSVFFGSPGFYDICLHAENANGPGKDTCKNAYIYVKDEYSMCGYATDAVTSSRYGKLYDDGGNASNYSDNRKCSYLIDACASSVNLTFSSFNLLSGDYLEIYDGSDATAPLLGVFTGNSLPGGTAGITAASGKMYIRFITDGSGVSSGFIAEWNATPDATPAPVADFTFPATLYTDELIEFTSTSTGAGLQYSWDMEYSLGVSGNNGGDQATELYSYSTAGNYDVKLRVFNCAGSHSLIKTITVTDPTTKPLVDFEADKTLVPVQGVVSFTNKTLNGAYSFRWEITPSLGVTIKPGTTSRNITAGFLVPGSYEVKLLARNIIGEDSLVKTGYITVYDYCNPGVASTDGKIGISNVTFEAINNTSASGVTSYTNYVNSPQFAAVIKGGTYPISISRTNNIDPMNRKVWIDWNIDGDFDDAGEEVLSESASSNLTFKGNISVPLTAVEGFTRMRVGVSLMNDPNKPCGLNPVGEFEDYTVEVVADKVAPVLTLTGPENVNVERWYQYVEEGATAMDNIDGNLTSSVVITSNVDSTTEGVYTVKYEVTDQAGNTSVVTRTVVVTPDVTLPVITLNGGASLKQTVKTPFTDPGATATDYFNRNFTSLIIINSTVDTSKVGNYTITYEVTDLSGNKAIVIRNVSLVDDVAPVLTKTGPDPLYVDVNTTYAEPGVSASDNYDAAVNVVSGTVNVNQTGTYTLTYTATDAAGNIGTETRTVIVQDTMKPVIKINGLDTVVVDVFSSYNEPGATVTDNYCNGLNATITSPVVNVNRVGTYTVTYDVTDCEGNAAVTVTRVVKVVDRFAPVLQLKGFNTVRIMRWLPYVDSGVNYTDNYYSQAELTPLLVVSSNVNTLQEGVYEYCYDLTDPSGNRAMRVCRTVEVIANTTGISEELMNNAVNVYPNPTRGELNVAVDFGQNRPVKITIMNMLGETIATVDNAGVAKNTFTFDLNGFAAGLYMVKIESDGMSTVKKVNLVN